MSHAPAGPGPSSYWTTIEFGVILKKIRRRANILRESAVCHGVSRE
jgi:hypothetical protein